MRFDPGLNPVFASGAGLSLIILPTPPPHVKRSPADKTHGGLPREVRVWLRGPALTLSSPARKRVTHMGLRLHLAQESQPEPRRARRRAYFFVHAGRHSGRGPDGDCQTALAPGDDRPPQVIAGATEGVASPSLHVLFPRQRGHNHLGTILVSSKVRTHRESRGTFPIPP